MNSAARQSKEAKQRNEIARLTQLLEQAGAKKFAAIDTLRAVLGDPAFQQLSAATRRAVEEEIMWSKN